MAGPCLEERPRGLSIARWLSQLGTGRMGWQFRRSFKIAPGIRLNLGKLGASISTGMRRLRVSSGSRGTWLSTSIPGTGISYRQKLSARHRSVGTVDPGSSLIGTAFRLAVLGCLGFAVYVAIRGF
jgi:hypothetical protein